MRRSLVWAVTSGALCVSLGAACSDGSVDRDPGGRAGSRGIGASPSSGEGGGASGGGDHLGGAGGVPSGQAVGQDCSDDNPCRDGLTCGAQDVCEPAGEKSAGEACVISAECNDGQCIRRECRRAGEAVDAEPCASDADCAAGLRCNIVGVGLACAPQGEGDLADDCELSSDCFGGLACIAGKCALPPAGSLPFGAPWEGVECDPPVEVGVKAYFEVPGADGADELDFFRLPFPTDVRRRDGQLDLSRFPTPGASVLGVDPVKLYVDAITHDDSAWGAYPTVIFRFSGPFEFETFAQDALHFIDVTDPEQGRDVGWRRFYTDARTNYVCDNFVAVQPPFGNPLEPEHTYAVFILSEAGSGDDATTLLGRGDGEPVVASDNMAAVLGDDVPSDPALEAAHAAFAPLRAHLAAVDQPVANVLTASVFTVGKVLAPMAGLAAAVTNAAPPSASAWVKCDGVAPSRCPQAEGERACGDDVEGYDEYHALLSIPVFQQGTPPYLTPDDGGGIDTSQPSIEQVCLSITVPEGVPPAEGWPAIVHAHGTGGSFRSHVRDEVALELAEATPRFAVIGIDQVVHGPRRGASQKSPNHLFFNFLNPAAARGNPLQGAADQLSVARFVKSLDVPAEVTTGSAIKIDGSKLLFFGHSQGATEGSLMLPFGDDYAAAVLSGNGASLRDALRTKTKPENVAAALPLLLQDPLLSDPELGPGLTTFHPVLSLLQQWIDPADPLNFAAAIGSPLEGHEGKHLFQPFGIDDSYSPPVTMATFAVAAGLVQVTPHGSADPAYTEELRRPVDVGYQGPSEGLTLGLRQYGPPSQRDGHFVVFDVPAARNDVRLFFTGAVGASPPSIGE